MRDNEKESLQHNKEGPPSAITIKHSAALDRAIPDWKRSMPKVCEYLKKRQEQKVVGDDAFGVVFAITQYCNLSCRHCAVMAHNLNRLIEPTDGDLSQEQVLMIMQKIQRYSIKMNMPVFFMFGGGEPTLRNDFKEIVNEAVKLFGARGVGFCTNGTFRSPDDIIQMARNVALIEVSLDGNEEYHNKWRTPGIVKSGFNAYKSTMDLIKEAIRVFPEKLEVTSVVTRENLESLPYLLRVLRDMGVRNYSVHRPIPVGRMATQQSLIPGISDYYRLLVIMSSIMDEDKTLHLHLHHSLESIYSALLLGDDIHLSPLPMGSRRHSIGISWDGSVHFDPWSLVPPFDSFSPGNLLEKGRNLEDFWGDQSILSLMVQAKKANVRCHCCSERCTGGMRLSAMADFIVNRGSALTMGDFLAAVSQVDPACPLYEAPQ
jgi:MoaA/NifB/PqqE/SkfB family radical SAM enzyme